MARRSSSSESLGESLACAASFGAPDAFGFCLPASSWANAGATDSDKAIKATNSNVGFTGFPSENQFVAPPLGGNVRRHGMDPHPALPPKGGTTNNER